MKLVRVGCLLLVLTLQAMPSGAAQTSCPCLPPPCPVPTETVDLTALCVRLESIEKQIAAVQKQQNKKPPIRSLLGNRFVDVVLTAVAVAATTVIIVR